MTNNPYQPKWHTQATHDTQRSPRQGGGDRVTVKAHVRQADITRAIKAAEQAGLKVAGITADGTVITYKDGENPLLRSEQ